MTRPKPPDKKSQTPSPHNQAPGMIPEKVLPEIYYSNQTFWLINDKGEYSPTNTDVVRRRLKRCGFSGDSSKSLNSEIDNILDDAVNLRTVRYAGAIAGFKSGVREMLGRDVLVTESPRIIEASPDPKNPFVYDYIERLLGDEAIYFHGWLKKARQAFMSGNLRSGQAMIITGKPNHGKSLLATYVPWMFGKRVADPEQYLTGQTSFNAHLFEAELLLLDDKGANNDFKTRRMIADGIKQIVAGANPQCHAKGQKPITLTPFWRVMMLVNDNAESLTILPAMDGTIDKKLIILRTCAYAVDRDTTPDEEWDRYGAQFEAAIPDYLGWLDQWEMPAELLHETVSGDESWREGGRFGIIAYHNKDILEMLQQFTPEEKLRDLIMDEIQTGDDRTLTARQIESELKAPGISSVEREAGQLLRGPGSCGKYLNRLVKMHPELVTYAGRVGGGSERYTILAKAAETPKAVQHAKFAV